MSGADGNYSINPWMRPDVRLGDDVDPSVWLDPGEVLVEIATQVPFPVPAGIQPRLLGMERTQPGIVDVLGVAPYPTLMRDTETRQDSGMQGTLRPATGSW